MQKLIFLPQLELNMEDIHILRWMAEEGEFVAADADLIEVETQKASTEVGAPQAGYLRKKLVKEGDRITGTDPVGIFTDSADEPFEDPKIANAETSPPLADAGELYEPVGSSPLPSPAVRRLARERGIDLASLMGSGPGGRILEADLRASSSAASDIISFSPARQALIRQMQASLRDIPQIHVVREMDVTPLMVKEPGITFSHRLILALGKSLAAHPDLCAIVRSGGFERISPCVAVAMDVNGGLTAPVVRRPDTMTLPQVAADVVRLQELASVGSLGAADLREGPFALSNLGMLGVDFFQAFVFDGQVAVLAVGRARPDEATFRAWFSLALDHRVADGAEAARFLRSLQENITAQGESL